MFSLLYKLNIIKSQNKTKIIFIIGSITYILIHYILFNDMFDRLQIKYIQYPRYLIYIVFAIDLIYYNNLLNEEKIMKRLGINLPFIVLLNKYLIDYNLIDNYILDYTSLGGALWK